MASPELKRDDAEGPSVLCETSCPVDFTQISPSKFGISTQSFTPSSGKRKDKSQLAKIKARRSAIGARGSPETNALIRFMAQQRAKTPPSLKTPEAVKSSPFLPRVSSTLKEKMASFQSLMDVEEGEHCDPVAGPKQDQSDESLDGDKENSSPTSMPSKRRRMGPPGACESEISGASSPILQHFSSQAYPEITPFEVRSVGASGRAVLVAVDLPAQRALPFPSSSSSPAPLEMKPFVAPPPPPPPGAAKYTKRVRFGGPLSPELFDKNLPPSTPLQRGTTPPRPQTPGSGLRSLLKTPQRPAGWSPLPQPLLSLASFGTSPTLSLPRQRRARTPGNDCEQIAFPSMEEIDSPSVPDAGVLNIQPLDLNLAFQEECLGEVSPSGAAEAEAPAPEDPRAPPEEPPAPPPVEPEADPEPVARAPVSSDTPRRKARSGAQRPSAAPAPVRPVGRKRKQPQQSEPVKRSSRSAAKSATGKMKTARRWGSKEVDRSLYGSRDYASKNPALSPITEGLGCLSPWPAPPPPGSGSRQRQDVAEDPVGPPPAPSEEAVDGHPGEAPPAPPLQRDDHAPHGGSDAARPSEAPAGATAAAPDQEPPGSGGGKRRAGRPPKARRRRGRKPGVSVEAGLPEEPREQPEARVGGPGGGEARSPQPPSGAHTPAGEGREPDSHAVRRAPVEPCPPPELAAGDGARHTEEEEEEKEKEEEKMAPWQTDFILDDVFKPAATRGRRSVRRSFRNHSSSSSGEPVDHEGLGLAWLPHTSPESIRETRRHRRLSSAPRPPSNTEASSSSSPSAATATLTL